MNQAGFFSLDYVRSFHSFYIEKTSDVADVTVFSARHILKTYYLTNIHQRQAKRHGVQALSYQDFMPSMYVVAYRLTGWPFNTWNCLIFFRVTGENMPIGR